MYDRHLHTMSAALKISPPIADDTFHLVTYGAYNTRHTICTKYLGEICNKVPSGSVGVPLPVWKWQLIFLSRRLRRFLTETQKQALECTVPQVQNSSRISHEEHSVRKMLLVGNWCPIFSFNTNGHGDAGCAALFKGHVRMAAQFYSKKSIVKLMWPIPEQVWGTGYEMLNLFTHRLPHMRSRALL